MAPIRRFASNGGTSPAGSRRHRQRLRRAGHVLPQSARRGGSEPKRLRAAGARVRARGARRSAPRAPPSRPARGARGIRSCRRRRAVDARLGRRLVARAREGRYVARVSAREFAFDLRSRRRSRCCSRARRVLAQGSGPRAVELLLQPAAARRDRNDVACRRRAAVSGTAWLDHEWSSTVMAPEAVGWDWTGINLADGGALMAFRMRDEDGRACGQAGRCAAPTAGCERLRRTRSASRRSGAGARHARGSSIRWRWSSAAGGVTLLAALRRPGTRLAREHGHDLLGGRGAGAGRRARGRSRVSRTDRLRGAAAVLNGCSGDRPRFPRGTPLRRWALNRGQTPETGARPRSRHLHDPTLAPGCRRGFGEFERFQSVVDRRNEFFLAGEHREEMSQFARVRGAIALEKEMFG